MKIPSLSKVHTYTRILRPVAKHHYFIVTIILFSGVGVGVYWVNETLNMPADDAYRAQQQQSTIGSKFNQSTKDTITKIETLQKSTDSTPTSALPSGRINPFAE